MALKKLFPALIILLLANCGKPKPKHVWIFGGLNDEVEMLNGPVKEIYTGDSTLARSYFERIDFDENGKMTHRKERFVQIDLNDSDLMIKESHYKTATDKEGKKAAVIEYSQLIRIRGHDLVKDTSRWVLNKNGQMASCCNINSDSDRDAVRHYKYNASGDLTEFKRTWGPVLLEPDIYTYRYDNNHQMIQSDLYEDRHLMTTYFEYESIDSNNNWLVREVKTKYYPPLQQSSKTETTTRKITYY